MQRRSPMCVHPGIACWTTRNLGVSSFSSYSTNFLREKEGTAVAASCIYAILLVYKFLLRKFTAGMLMTCVLLDNIYVEEPSACCCCVEVDEYTGWALFWSPSNSPAVETRYGLRISYRTGVNRSPASRWLVSGLIVHLEQIGVVGGDPSVHREHCSRGGLHQEGKSCTYDRNCAR